MTTQSSSSTEYETYYVPDKSKLAVCATIGLMLSIFGAARIMNDMKFGDPGESTSSWSIFLVGLFFFVETLFNWFRITIKETWPDEQRTAEEILCVGHVLVHLLGSHVLRRLLWRAVLRPHLQARGLREKEKAVV